MTAVTGIPEQPFTFYMGTTGGGVWRTDNAGLSWENISDGDFGVDGPVPVAAADGQIRQVEAPFHLRCLPAFYDMRSFLGPARGGLNFANMNQPREVYDSPPPFDVSGLPGNVLAAVLAAVAWLFFLPDARFRSVFFFAGREPYSLSK